VATSSVIFICILHSSSVAGLFAYLHKYGRETAGQRHHIAHQQLNNCQLPMNFEEDLIVQKSFTNFSSATKTNSEIISYHLNKLM